MNLPPADGLDPTDHRDPTGDATVDELYDHAPCGYLSLRPDGTIARVNRTFLGWTGFDGDALLGRHFSDLLTVGGRIYYETHCAPLLLMTGTIREVALDVRCASGAVLSVLFGADVVAGDDGHPVGARVTLFDASHRRSYERELLASRQRERHARERAEGLQRVAERLGGLMATSEVESAIIGELIGAGIVEHAEIVGPARRDPHPVPVFAADPATGAGVGTVPLTSSAGGNLATMRVRAVEPFVPDDQDYLVAVAELGGRALERMQRIATLVGAPRGGDVTGLPNERWWKSTLSAELRQAAASRRHLTLVAVELVGFEGYTRTHGHVAGDERLLQITDAWRAAGLDLLSRHGGEEFVALLSGATQEDARRIVATIRAGLPGSARFAAGIAQWDRAEDGPRLVLRADQALQQELGRARR